MDKYWGRLLAKKAWWIFTWGRVQFSSLAVILSSDVGGVPPCCLVIRIGRNYVEVALPPLIRRAEGRFGTCARDYGFGYRDRRLFLYYGAQSLDKHAKVKMWSLQ